MWCVSVGLKSAWRNGLRMLSWPNWSPEGRGSPPSWLHVLLFPFLALVLTWSTLWAESSLDREKNRRAGMVFWDLCELNLPAKIWVPVLETWEGVGLWLGAEQGGVGVGGRKWDLAFWQQQQQAVRCYQQGVKCSQSFCFIGGVVSAPSCELSMQTSSQWVGPACWSWLKTSPATRSPQVWENFLLTSKVVLLWLQACCTCSCDERPGAKTRVLPHLA